MVKNNPDSFPNHTVTNEEKMDYLNNSSYINTLIDLPKWFNYGDIFARKTTFSFDNFSLTGHAGIGDYDHGYTIEAYMGETIKYRYDYYTRWTDAGYKAKIMRPYDVSLAQYEKATNYAIAQIGKPYNKTFQSTGDGYYCSELVYFAWKHASTLKLRVSDGENLIRPAELIDTPKTYEVAKSEWPK